MYQNINKRVSLVGAGPGDPDLFTLKGIKALNKAKVVLYDALIGEEILNHAPENAIKVFVGKRSGNHSLPQEEINKLIVEYTLTIGDVVRLKGGDPFVFGRGNDELEYAQAFGIEVDVVPGISSSISLAGLQQVPITARGYADGFWVLTGTKKDRSLPKDFYIAAKSSSTVVVLMGLNKLAEIAKIYQNEGRGDLPVMIISNGSLKTEQVVYGTMNTIVEKSIQENVKAPATIVIGEVVGLKHKAVLKEVEYLLN